MYWSPIPLIIHITQQEMLYKYLRTIEKNFFFNFYLTYIPSCYLRQCTPYYNNIVTEKKMEKDK